MSARLQPGQWIGRWRLEAPITRGSFGSTWRASALDGRIAALKVLKEAPGDELRALSRVCHPAVVAVLEGGGHPVPYVAMELARGRPLSALARARPPLERALIIVATLADALAAVHHAGLTHGDLKPENVMIGPAPDFEVRLVDFGLAGQAQGGTLAYAAPERLAGGPTSATADVYALGLLLWELTQGERPWPELEASEALLRRRGESPIPSQGPDWLRELISAALAVDPARRPSAAEMADAFRAQGVALPSPDVGLLRRRSRTIHVARPAVDAAARAWTEQGGLLALVGPAGSGRSHAQETLATELQARGRPWVRLVPSDHPWTPVEQALADPGLMRPPVPLPDAPDPADRAEAAALALEERSPLGLAVLVDDVDGLDEGTARTLSALARHGRVALCVAGTSAPPWAARAVSLEPFGRADIALLVESILGAFGEIGPLIDKILAVSGGLPGLAVDTLLVAVREGALVWRGYQWVLDEARLGAVVASGAVEVQLDAPLPPDAARLGAALAAFGVPASLELLARIAEFDEPRSATAQELLVEKGLAHVSAGKLRVASRAAARAMLAAIPDVAPYHRAAILALRDDARVSKARLGWHVVGARDAALARTLGPDAIRAARQHDPVEAARLSDALWELAPGPALAGPRIEALVAAGRAEEARAFGERFLDDRPLTPEVVPVLVSLGRVHTGFTHDDDSAMECVSRAHQALGESPPPWELLDLEAMAHFQAGRVDDAIRVSRAVAEEAPPTEPAAQDRWLTMRGIWAQALERGGDLRSAIAVLDAVPEELGRGRPARALLDAMHGRLLYLAGKIREAGRLMSGAAQEGSGLSTLDRARNLNNAAICSIQGGDLAGALARWEQALLLFERLGSTLEEVRVQINLGVGYREAGRWERARQASRQAAERAAALGVPDLEAAAVSNLGDLHLSRGAWDEAESCYDRADAIAVAHGLERFKVEQARRRAELAVSRQDPGALALAQAAERASARVQDEIQHARAEALIAVCQARARRADAVDDALGRAIEPLRRAGAARELAEVRIWAAEALLALGRTEDALAELDRVVVYAEEGGQELLRSRAEALARRARAGARAAGGDERLDHLLALAVDVARERDLRALLDRIANSAMELLQADRSFVILDRSGRGATSDADLVVAAQASRPDVPPGPLSMSVVSLALSRQREVIAPDVVERGDLRTAQSVRAMHLRSVMCVPLVDGTDTLGAIYVDSLTASEQELSEAARFLRGLAAFAAVAVTNAHRLRDADSRAERAAELAHDLSKPVASVLSIAHELETRHELDRAVREGLDDIVVYGERALSLARSLLSDGARPHRIQNLARIALRHVDELSREARRKGITLRMEGPDPVWVKCDADELGRALTNIISNALKYSPSGSEVLVSLAVEEGWTLCSVRDHGAGIPAESMPHIFDRGVQGTNARDGHGLGLAIARRVVEDDHGGQIWAENAPDGGAVFTIKLPLGSPRQA